MEPNVPLLAQELSQASSTTVAEEQDYTFAAGLYSDSLFQLAGQQFETFVKKYPNSIKRQDAAFLHVECLFQISQFQNAVTKYKEFIQKYPASRLVPEAYLKLGQSYLNQKKYSDAIVAFKTLLDKFSENESAGEAAYWIGEAFLQSGDAQNAIKYYTLSYENYPKNRLRDYALYSIAWSFQRQTEYSKAAEWYRKLIAEFPQSSLASGAHVRVGECFYYAKQFRNAIDALNKSRNVIQDGEELGNCDYILAEAYNKLGDINEAQTRYKKFIIDHQNHPLTSEVMYDLAWSYYEQRNYTKAIDAFDKLTGRSDELGYASLYRRGAAERFAGNIEKALETFSEVIQREPQGKWSDNSLFDSGMIYFEETNTGKAKQYFQRLVAEYPDGDMLPVGHRMLGECLLIEGKYKDAQLCFEKAMAVPSVSSEVKVEASFQSAFCDYKLKQYNEASSKFAALSLKYPKHSKAGEAKFYQADAEYRIGNYDASRRLYQEAADNVGAAKKEEALYGIAWALYKQEKFQQAIESFEHLLVNFPKGKFAFDTRLRLGDAYFFLKNYQKAIASYRIVIRMYPDSASIDYAYYQIGQSYLREGNNNEALSVFNEFKKELPQSKLADDAQFAIGWVNFQRKEYGEAIKEFNRLIKIYQNSELVPRAYYSLGDSYYNIQQYAAAEKSYREVLRQFPKSNYVVDAASGIQYCLIASGKESEAVKVLDDFVKENPTSPIAEELDLKKGDLLFNQKKYSEAEKGYREFAVRYPNSKLLANAQYSVARCYGAQGKPDEASLAFERAANIPAASEKVIGESLFEAAEIYSSRHKSDQAIDILQTLQKRVKDREIIAESKIRTGLVLLSIGKKEEANSQFENVIQNFGDLQIADEARIEKSRIYLESRQYDQAKALAEKVASSRKDELGAEAQYIIGASLAGKKEWKDVITALLKVRYVFPSFSRWVGRANLGLGDAYEQTKDLQKAREAYRSVLNMKTDKSVIEEAQRRLKQMEKR